MGRDSGTMYAAIFFISVFCSLLFIDPNVDTLLSMRTECATLITDGLSYVSESIIVLWLTVDLGTITGNKKAIMNYVNYDTAIMRKYSVRLDGWPGTITFASPHNICTIDEIRLLRHQLLEKTCKWVRLTREEVKRHMDEYAAHVRDGVAGRKRKVRSDKGKSRKTRKVAVDNEDDGEDIAEDENESNDEVGGMPASRRSLRAAKYKSQPVIDDGDSADGSDGSGDAYEDD